MRRVTRGKLWRDWNTPGFLYIWANGMESMVVSPDPVATWTVGGWREGHGGSGARVPCAYTVELAICAWSHNAGSLSARDASTFPGCGASQVVWSINLGVYIKWFTKFKGSM